MAANEKKAGEAEYPDVSTWGDKDVSGAYPKGTMAMIGGVEVDLSTIPDLLGGEARPDEAAPEKPAS